MERWCLICRARGSHFSDALLAWQRAVRTHSYIKEGPARTAPTSHSAHKGPQRPSNRSLTCDGCAPRQHGARPEPSAARATRAKAAGAPVRLLLPCKLGSFFISFKVRPCGNTLAAVKRATKEAPGTAQSRQASARATLAHAAARPDCLMARRSRPRHMDLGCLTWLQSHRYLRRLPEPQWVVV